MYHRKFRYIICFFFLVVFALSCKPVADLSTDTRARQPISQGNLSYTDTDAGGRDTLVRKLENEIRNYKASQTRHFDLIHTELSLSFDYALQSVRGEATLTLTPYRYLQNNLVLDAKEFEIDALAWINQGEKQELSYTYDQQQIKIDFPKKVEPNDTLLIFIAYQAFPERGLPPGQTGIPDTKGLYFINPDSLISGKPVQIWTQGETSYTSKWYPTIDQPNERQTHDFYLRVPEKYISISNGSLVNSQVNRDGTRTDHWRMDLPHAPYLSAIVVGDFAVIEDQSDAEVPLRYLAERKYEAGIRKVFANTPEMMRFFSELLQVPFPWQKYDQVIVRDFVAGAMENTTLSVFMEALNLNAREALDSEWDYIIAHELFHQWFGNYVTTESWANLTLNEAFADYGEYLWFEYKEGRDQADMHHFNAMEEYLDEAEEKQVDLIRYYHSDSEDMFDSHTYAKGGRVLHMLRQYLGEEVFFQGLHVYLVENAFQPVEIHHLRLAMEKVSGRDLNWFFNQWFLSSGHPELTLTWDRSDPENVILSIEQQQDLSHTPLYKLPFSVRIYRGGEVEEKEFVLDQASQQFSLENGPETDAILFDEFHTILAAKSHHRGSLDLERQFRHAASGLARLEALDSLTRNVRAGSDTGKWIAAGLQDSFAVVRELALQRLSEISPEQMEQYPIENQVLRMAEEDASNTVKAAALEVLGVIDPQKYEGMIYRMINDSSYQVSGTALMVFMDMEGNLPRKQELFERFEGEENIRILAPLANYITDTGQARHADWMHTKLAVLEGESLYYFIGYYGDFFASVEGVSLGGAISRLGEIGGTHSLPYVRLAAFQSLFGFIDEEGVLDLARSLLESEADETVRRYKSYYLEPYLDQE
ncbi:aminopeptidase N [Cyclobacterium lianum]|uniref:Aminopeptidase N n=1 Tax=Cyclobacterium lianum TaxID=388280 RepID=A0A1M7PKC9_9BACT|nr:M1 family metallopeptidase [Cyclobacterium lianum]SHN17408.1 aminopeptidase N [Cyclobacterium lianum]